MRHVFTEAELRSLLQNDKGQFLEFKSLWDHGSGTRKVLDRRTARDTIAQCIAAFANSDGGTLLLGVDDDGSPTGRGYPDEAIDELLAGPRRRLRPAAAILPGSVYRDRPVEDTLHRMGLSLPKAGGVAVNNAALLLFAKRPFARRGHGEV